MALNPYTLNGASGEQALLQSLMNEQIRMYGIEVFYIPRKYIKTNTVIKEVIESKFDDAYPIEAYVDNYEGYGGQGTLLGKFGIQEMDDLTLIISRERFEEYISPLMKNLPDVKLWTRPKEGDIIYFPLGDRLFEIKYVEHEQPFYQLKKNYVYELRCELFRYEDEVLDTGIEEIDDEIENVGYIQTLTMISGATQATATASYVASGALSQIYITNMGNAYTEQPTIGIGSAPAGGTTAVGIASISTSLIGAIGEKTGKIDAIELANAGAGYTVSPWVTIIGGGTNATGAAATAGITTANGGQVGSVSIANSGGGYVVRPTVTFADPPTNGVTATGIATISTAGIVTAVYITNSGYGYTEAPTITLSTPAATGIGTGAYIYNEVITGQTSGATARVKKWNTTNLNLSISIAEGTFVKGEQINGGESGAKYILGDSDAFDTNRSFDTLGGTQEITPFADNKNIETQGDAILDFTESNPFGMP